MNLVSARKHKKRFSKTEGIIKNNVVFTLGLGLPIVIAVSTELKNAAVMCILMAITNIVGGLIHTLLGRRIKKIFRVPLAVLASMAAISLTLPLLSSYTKQISELGMYVPLMAVNSVTLDIILREKSDGLKMNLKRVVTYTIGFSIVMLVVSGAREMIGDSALWDIPFELLSFKISGVQTVFFGFILIGMLGAMFRVIYRTFKYIVVLRPKYSDRFKRKVVGS